MKTTAIAGLALAGAVVLGGPAAVSQAATGHEQMTKSSAHATPSCGCEHAHHPHHHKPPAAPHGGGHGRHHHQKHHAPKPAPKPCPPPKHHHHPKPPVVTPPSSTPIRPVITPAPPATNVGTTAHIQTVAAVTPASLPKQLAYTGVDLTAPIAVAVVLVGAGVLLISLVVLTEPARRFSRQVTR